MLATLEKCLVSNEPSPIKYNSPKPQDVLEEVKIVSAWKLDIQPEAVAIVPVAKVFE